MNRKLLVIKLNVVENNVCFEETQFIRWRDAGFDICAVCMEKLSVANRIILEKYCCLIIVTEKVMRNFIAWKKAIVTLKDEIDEIDVQKNYQTILLLDDTVLCDSEIVELSGTDHSAVAAEVAFSTQNKGDAYIINSRGMHDNSFYEFWNGLSGKVSDFSVYLHEFYEKRGYTVESFFCPEYGVRKNTFSYNPLADIASGWKETSETVSRLASFKNNGNGLDELTESFLLNTYTPEYLMQLYRKIYVVNSKSAPPMEGDVDLFVWANSREQIKTVIACVAPVSNLRVNFILDESNDELREALLEVESLPNSCQLFYEGNRHLFEILIKYKDMIAQCELVGLLDVCDYTDDTIRYYINHLIVDQHYLGAVNQIFTQDRKVATLCKLKSVYSDQFGAILKEYRAYSKELYEWRDRFHLSQKKDVAIPLVNYHMMLVRASACAQVIHTVLDDVEASSVALASSEWRVFPEILQSIGYLTGTISNMEFAAGEFYDLQQILGKMVLKVRNKENKNVATIDAYVNSIQKERVVTKTEIEYQDRLIPIGLKESLYFFFKKRFKFLPRK